MRLPFLSSFSKPCTKTLKFRRRKYSSILSLRVEMASTVISVDKVKEFLKSQVNDEEKWALNVKLLRAVGLFAGSILLMRNYGDLMAI